MSRRVFLRPSSNTSVPTYASSVHSHGMDGRHVLILNMVDVRFKILYSDMRKII